MYVHLPATHRQRSDRSVCDCDAFSVLVAETEKERVTKTFTLSRVLYWWKRFPSSGEYEVNRENRNTSSSCASHLLIDADACGRRLKDRESDRTKTDRGSMLTYLLEPKRRYRNSWGQTGARLTSSTSLSLSFALYVHRDSHTQERQVRVRFFP